MTWENTTIDLGTVKENITLSIIFKATEDLDSIKTMYSSCGCSTPSLQGSREILVKYNTGNIPVHLKNTSQYVSRKTITIVYKDDTKDVLSFISKMV